MKIRKVTTIKQAKIFEELVSQQIGITIKSLLLSFLFFF